MTCLREDEDENKSRENQHTKCEVNGKFEKRREVLPVNSISFPCVVWVVVAGSSVNWTGPRFRGARNCLELGRWSHAAGCPGKEEELRKGKSRESRRQE